MDRHERAPTNRSLSSWTGRDFDPLLRSSIGELIEDVRLRGDDAVCDALQKFDGVTLTPEQLRLTDDDIDSARVDESLHTALQDAISHLRTFNEHLLERASNWSIEIEPGLHVGEKYQQSLVLDYLFRVAKQAIRAWRTNLACLQLLRECPN